MSSSAIITLDTQAPVIDLGVAYRAGPNKVAIPYNLDEEAVVVSIVEVEGVGEFPSEVHGNEIISTGLPAGHVVLRVTLEAIDDVGNSNIVIGEFPILVFPGLIARVIAGPLLRAKHLVMPVLGGRIGTRSDE